MKPHFQNVTPGILLPFQTRTNPLQTLICYAVTFQMRLRASFHLLHHIRTLRRLGSRTPPNSPNATFAQHVAGKVNNTSDGPIRDQPGTGALRPKSQVANCNRWLRCHLQIREVQQCNILPESIDHQAIPLLHPGNSEVQQKPSLALFPSVQVPLSDPQNLCAFAPSRLCVKACRPFHF
jgi:hypothetical protein